jgi:hypothetical protein
VCSGRLLLAMPPRRLESVTGVVRGFRFKPAGAASSSGVDATAEATEEKYRHRSGGCCGSIKRKPWEGRVIAWQTMWAQRSKRWPIGLAILVGLGAARAASHVFWVQAMVYTAVLIAAAFVLRFAFAWPWRRILRHRERAET